MKDQKTKVFLYARRSSDESSDKQLQSIEDQINNLKPLAAKHGLKIVATLEESKSAKEPHIRPVFESMIKRIEAGEAEGIITWHVNRLSRNPIDSATISWMLQKNDIKVIQTYDREYLPEDNVLLFNVETSMANQYVRDLAKVSRRGMQGKADRGWLPSKAAIGYYNYNDTVTIDIRVDEERFDMVRKMWELLLTGNYTVPQIQQIANEEWGFRTRKHKRSGGTPIALSTMYRMFTNQFYTGMFEWSGDLYEGNHKAIVTVEEFDKAQIILGRKGKPRQQVHDASFTGLVHCGECDCMCTYTAKQKIVETTGELKTYAYYHCTKKKNKNKKDDITCKQKPVTLESFEEQIDIELERFTILPKFQEWAIEIINRKNDGEIKERTKIYESQQKAYNETQKQLDTLTQMRYRELIDDEEFLKEKTDLKQQLAKLKLQLNSTENRAEKWLELTEKTFDFARYARKEFMHGSIQQKREIFAALGQNFTLKDKKVFITPNDWFVPIEKAYPELEAKFKRLELAKNLDTASRNAQYAELILTWGDYRESNPNCRYHKPVH